MEQLFITHVIRNYQDNSNRKYGIGIIRRFVEFLIKSGLISNRTIRHYTILNEFDRMIITGQYKNKTQTIQALSEQLDLHENTIWNTIKDHRAKFFHAMQEP